MNALPVWAALLSSPEAYRRLTFRRLALRITFRVLLALYLLAVVLALVEA